MSTTILVGDVRARLNDLPEASVQCCVTSPPYFGLRDYGTAQWDGGDAECDHIAQRVNLNVGFNERWGNSAGDKKQEAGRAEQYRHECGKCGATRQDAQIGLEPTLAAYLAAMVEVFRGVRRVLRPDGVVFLNIGDSYNSGATTGFRPGAGRADGIVDERGQRNRNGTSEPSLKAKDLMMVPARLAIALQDDGWYLRSDIIWAKPNPMPESVTDRPTSAHEHIFLLTKSARYYWDQDAVREESTSPNRECQGDRAIEFAGGTSAHKQPYSTGASGYGVSSAGRNLRNVWEIATQGFPGSHFAVFPMEIPRRCIKAGTSEKGCCAACGAPWRRVVERERFALQATYNGAVVQDGFMPNGGKRWSGGVPSTTSATTTGWEPTCTCAADVIPCTVLDPFLGSGTTLLVADQLGRNGIGIELNPVYAEMSRERITGDAPMFATVAIDAA